jgi:hypothetical protein
MAYDVDSYTTLLIHFDGTDGDTADQTAATGQTVSLEGNAQLDTAQKQFGTASLLLDGTGDYATSDKCDFGTGHFTIEMWVRFNSLSTSVFFSQRYDVKHQYYLQYDHSAKRLYFTSYNGDSGASINNVVFDCYTPWEPSVDTWYHIEVSRGYAFYIFIDDEMQSVTHEHPQVIQTMPTISYASTIGSLWTSGGYIYYFNGWIDELRVSTGIARHTANEANFLELFW